MAKAALDDGLYLMTRWNMVMVCPPLNISVEELDEGITILDEALAVADSSSRNERRGGLTELVLDDRRRRSSGGDWIGVAMHDL